MESENSLIDKALQACSRSGYRLAQELGEDASYVGKLARGQKKLSAGMAARIAAIAGEDPVAAILSVVIDQEEDDAKRAMLETILTDKEWRKRSPGKPP